jgi:hypothetical protein
VTVSSGSAEASGGGAGRAGSLLEGVLVRVAVSRNLAEHAFTPAMSSEDFAEVERVLLIALRALPQCEERSIKIMYNI